MIFKDAAGAKISLPTATFRRGWPRYRLNQLAQFYIKFLIAFGHLTSLLCTCSSVVAEYAQANSSPGGRVAR